jgi:hypothetical protein
MYCMTVFARLCSIASCCIAASDSRRLLQRRRVAFLRRVNALFMGAKSFIYHIQTAL